MTEVASRPAGWPARSGPGAGRQVVITDVASAYPVSTREEAHERVLRACEIWRRRLAQVNQTLAGMGGPEAIASEVPPAPAVYFGDPEAELPVRCLGPLPPAFVLASERINLHLLEALLDRCGRLAQPVHISHGDPADDLSKATFLSALGVFPSPDLVEVFMDPFGTFGLLEKLAHPSVSQVTEASASGSTALIQSVERVRSGTTDTAFMVSSSAKSIPIPWETARSGVGDTRSALPFCDQGSGHFGAEGGVALVLREEEAARSGGQPPLARISGWAVGAAGSAVVNRIVVADTILRCLAQAGVMPDEPVLVDLYGRGNRVDDTAELSAVERVQKVYPNVASAYLSGDHHYVCGSHGLQGLVGMLAARASGQSPSALALHQDSAVLAGRRMAHLVADPADYTKIVFLTYSMHGTCVAILADLDVDGGVPAGPRGGVPAGPRGGR